MSTSTANALSYFLEKELKSVSGQLITKESDNRLIAFGRFAIDRKSSALIQVTDTLYRERLDFSRLKFALAWCILQHHFKFSVAKYLHTLDLKSTSIELDVMNSRRLVSTEIEQPVDRNIQITKLKTALGRKRKILSEIDALLKIAINLQSFDYAKPINDIILNNKR